MSNQNIKNQIVPAYTFGEPNKSTLLAKDEVLIKDNGETFSISGSAEIRLDLQPKPRIHMYITNLVGSIDTMCNELYLELKNHKKSSKGSVIFGELFNSSGSLIFSPFKEPIIGVNDDSIQMQYIIFHIFNFKKISESGINLEADNWIIELNPCAESNKNFDKLKKEGGYGLTHIGCLRRKDNKFILGKEAMEIFFALQYFFSFAKGAWCNPVSWIRQVNI